MSVLGLCVRPFLRQGARALLCGADLRGAVRLARRHALRGRAVALGYWNAAGEDPEAVLQENLGALRALAGMPGDGYLSVKLPGLGDDPEAAARLFTAAREAGVRVHADSLGPAVADAILAAGVRVGATAPMGVTLPGRWRRSPDDARRLAATSLRIRVVKGEWADPEPGGPQPRAGYLEVVGALAGRAGHVSVATHDAPLARQALRRLQDAGTPCDLEVLATLPSRAVRAVARRAGVPVRVYVPFGASVLDAAIEFALAHRNRLAAYARDL